ncbi:type II toxin-antitoxin system VapC family toxin [Planctomonas deserti]|uniref:type II toxin-antitoxin system VapC family toxin n=1 Tax=Planctomonas deserti TaxID=2144185 RepID=UPI00131F2A60|nr:type II toxin-antitoxin system VapC family toxin [Planctomonas deserti]
MIVHLDTSAVAKLVIEEAESAALAEKLDELASTGATLLTSALAETELRRLARRVGGLEQSAVTDVLARLTVVDLDRATYRQTGVLPGAALRSLDALHIASALQVAADLFATFDRLQEQAALDAGLTLLSVLEPGGGSTTPNT